MSRIIRSAPVSGVRRLMKRSNQPFSGMEPDVGESHVDAWQKDSSVDEIGVEKLQFELEKLRAENEKLSTLYKEQQETLALLRKERDEQITTDDSEGYQKGYKRGEQLGRESYEKKLGSLGELVGLIENKVDEELLDVDAILADLAFASLCKVLESHLVRKKYVISSVNKVLDDFKSVMSIKLHLSPEHYQLLSEEEVVFQGMACSNKIELISDSRVDLGGCIVETESGSWDGRLESQLQRLYEVVKGVKGHEVNA